MTEHVMERRPPVATICWGFGVSAVFWAVVQPWWRFPFGEMTASHSLQGRLDGISLPGWALIVFVVLLGTVLPFGMLVTSLHALPAARVTLLATFEPVAAALIAWIWLEEKLTTTQLAGGALVLVGILAAETASTLQNTDECERFTGRSKGI
jgi:drug/metabolite transporter (DMT)-like permease